MFLKISMAFAFALTLFPASVFGQEVFVAVASSLTHVISDIVDEFEAETAQSVNLSLGPSGVLYAQIREGAPFDVFLSADVHYPSELIRSGRAGTNSLFVYALGRLVLWTAYSSPIDPLVSRMKSLLLGSGRISVANPKHAPYGLAALAAMEHFGLRDQLAERIVRAESVAQAAQFVQSGAADIGLIPLSLARSVSLNLSGRYWEVPLEAYPALEHGGVILQTAEERGRGRSAQMFVDWLCGQKGREILAKWGFSFPGDFR